VRGRDAPGLTRIFEQAFATSENVIGFASATSSKPYFLHCQLPTLLGTVTALAMDMARDSRYAYVSTSHQDLVVFDRHARQAAPSSKAAGAGIRAIFGAPTVSTCALVHRALNASAKHLTVSGQLLVSAPGAVLRSPHTKWARVSQAQPAVSYARAAADAHHLIVFNRDGRSGLVLTRLHDEKQVGGGVAAGSGGAGGAMDWTSTRGVSMLVLGCFGAAVLLGRGGPSFMTRRRAPPSANIPSTGRRAGFVASGTT
jgi:hypothetical protein